GDRRGRSLVRHHHRSDRDHPRGDQHGRWLRGDRPDAADVQYAPAAGGAPRRRDGAPMTPTWVQLAYLACAVCFILALKGLCGPPSWPRWPVAPAPARSPPGPTASVAPARALLPAPPRPAPPPWAAAAPAPGPCAVAGRVALRAISVPAALPSCV